MALLEAEGIDVSAVGRLEGSATGVALIVVDAAGENQIAVASGANAELGADAVEAALRGADGGVVLLGFEVPDAPVLRRGAGRARRRPRGRGEPRPGPRAARRAARALPLLTPNLDEARALAGEDDAEAAARALAARTGAPVVVTLGPTARSCSTARRSSGSRRRASRWSTPRAPGDAFNGALACELAGGAALLDAVRSAIAVAARSTCAPGARTVIPRGAPG